ncbi:hypothetical protein FRX31_033772 [Thalictrum thalictroides]|uniref:Uncharacterized protein n=1 Tax=Thalictrum thalictroides TaxID=46969 RepID=A0A7J6UWU0_THATH|nr:hypothetical protein FRX31_033772 [Thalictrum thalictroides]
MEFDEYHHKRNARLSLCLTCIFRKHNHNRHQALEKTNESATSSPRLLRSISSGLKSKAQEKCRNVFCRTPRKTRRHSKSADFGYDPWSYALNFDEGINDDNEDNSPYASNFSMRLPETPLITPSPSQKKVPSEIAAFS